MSPTLLRALADALRGAAEPSVVAMPLAGQGIAALGLRRDALEQFAPSVDRGRITDFTIDWMVHFDRVRSALDVLDLPCEKRYENVLSDLVVRRRGDVARLAPFALDAKSEDYGFLTELAHRVWRALDPAPGTTRRSTAAPRKKILFWHYTTSRKPGSTTSFERMVDNWDRDRYAVSIALPCKGDLYRYLEGRFDVSVWPLNWIQSERDVSACNSPEMELADVYRRLEALAPDMVFLSGAAPTLSTAARLLRIPCVAYSHMPYFAITPAARQLVMRRAQLASPDVLVAASKYMADRLDSVLRPPPGRLRVVHCGIPVERFVPGDRATARTKLGLPPDRPLVGLVGLLTHAKRPELAIAAMSTVRETVPEALLAIAGAERFEAGYAGKLTKLIADMGLTDHVMLLGHVEDVPAVYAAVDVLAHAAMDEPFAQVIPEAMAMDRAVVAFRAGGPAEIVVDGGDRHPRPP